MAKILFVPQTHRNVLLLKAYAEGLPGTTEIVFLHCNLLGAHLETIKENFRPAASWKIAEPAFMLENNSPAGEWSRYRRLRLLNPEYVQWLRREKPDLVVLGSDATGVGRWSALAARACGIPTLVCQEGCRHLYELDRAPLKIRVKRFLTQIAYRMVNPIGVLAEEFMTADFAAVWGEHNRRMLRRKTGVYVVGSPETSLVRKKLRPAGASPRILFLDTPFSSVSKGTFDVSSINRLRFEMFGVLGKENVEIWYKPHPFTLPEEREPMRRALEARAGARFIETGDPMELYKDCDACMTFPSTCVLTSLAYGIPLFHLELPIAGWGKMLWNPVERFDAGVAIHRPGDLAAAVGRLRDSVWLAEYSEKSRRAALDVAGPLDGKAPERFAECVSQILNYS